MKEIPNEDVSKFIPHLTEVLKVLGQGCKRSEVESEITIGDTIAIANIKGYWVGDLIRIDIKFRS
jgi:hypothetical protein